MPHLLLYSATVERVVKERLIGAAVLMAAAVILVPEMLTGPKRAETPDEQSEALSAAVRERRVDAPIKTYTIDLSQPSGNSQTASQPPGPSADDARAPPPEEVAPEAGDLPASAAATSGPARAGAPAEVRAAASPAPSAPVPKAAAPAPVPAPGGAARPAAGAAASPAGQAAAIPGTTSGGGTSSGGWAVQVGSFSKRETARQLAEQLRAHGHESFVMPVQAKGSTLYRVRVGPMKDRASAEAKARQLKASGASTSAAAVVPHP